MSSQQGWLRWSARVCLLIPALVATAEWSHWCLVHPQLWFTLRYLLLLGVSLLAVTGIAWKWTRVGGVLAIAWGACALWYSYVDLDWIFLPIYGVFILGGILNLVSAIRRF